MGYVYLFTGTGGGKTTNALGLALRSVGHKHRVVVIQFLKWWKKTGEYKIRKKLAPYYEIHQFGRKGWIGLDNLCHEDKLLAEQGLDFAEKIMKKKKPHLLVLDEANLACHCRVLSTNKLVKFLKMVKKKYKRTDVVLTGRSAPVKLKQAADFVNIINDAKMPRSFKTTKGVQY